MVIAAGFEPRQIPIKALFPLLDGASLEDDDSMQDRWAALIANAANPAASVDVKPAFAGILKSLSPQEAGLLSAIYDTAVGELHEEEKPHAFGAVESRTYPRDALVQIRYNAGLTKIPANLTRPQLEQYGEENVRRDARKFAVSLNLLISQHLLATTHELDLDFEERLERLLDRRAEYKDTYHLTSLGYEFVIACRPPERTAEKSSPESSSG